MHICMQTLDRGLMEREKEDLKCVLASICIHFMPFNIVHRSLLNDLGHQTRWYTIIGCRPLRRKARAGAASRPSLEVPVGRNRNSQPQTMDLPHRFNIGNASN